MKPGQAQTGTVEHCSPTIDGRFFVIIAAGRHKAHGYSAHPVNVGGSATVVDGEVRR